jgi:hypothetical protein
MIPAAVLEDVERAFVSVLRRRHPNALFIVRDIGNGEAPVSEDDADVLAEFRARATVDLNAVNEAGENGAALESVEALPKSRKRSTRRKASQGGG